MLLRLVFEVTKEPWTVQVSIKNRINDIWYTMAIIQYWKPKWYKDTGICVDES